MGITDNTRLTATEFHKIPDFNCQAVKSQIGYKEFVYRMRKSGH